MTIRELRPVDVTFVASNEGERLMPYYDSGHVLTDGFGHTGPDVHLGEAIDHPTAIKLLDSDLWSSRVAVCNALSPAVLHGLTDNEYGALVDFAYNIGGVAFRNSTLVRELNAGNFDDVPNQLMLWIRVHRTIVPGLVNRRRAEVAYWKAKS